MSKETITSLEKIARSTHWKPGIELKASTINIALIDAGYSVNNEKERTRFCSLVEEAYFRKQRDEISDLGKYYDEATLRANGSASIDEIIEEAHRVKENAEEE
jgi:hypothetical protein